MSLATRCTACGTVFRVVQDQLKVSEGWVRCGRCREVFHAQKCLFDLARDTPPPWQAPPAAAVDNDPAPVPDEPADASAQPPITNLAPPPRTAAGLGGANAGVAGVAGIAADTSNTGFTGITANAASAVTNASDALDTRLFAPRRADNDSPSDRIADVDRNEFADAQFPPGFEPDGFDGDGDTAEDGDGDGDDDSDGDPVARQHRARSPDYVLLRSSTFGDDIDDADLDLVASARAVSRFNAAQAAPFEVPSAMPSFVARAQRSERWTQPVARRALRWLAAFASATLVAQTAMHFRHRIAAQWPDSAPRLQQYCAVVGCRIDALRRIDDVSIESTALTQAASSDPASADSLRLTVTLRNRGELPIALPSVDLNLTDADGELVARRSLSPADFRVTEPLLKPARDMPLQVHFSVAGRRVSGYTVEVFYP